MKHSRHLLPLLAATALVTSCANRGMGPQGGPADHTPPVIKSSRPEQNATNFNGKKVDIYFDEIVQIDNPTENVVVSPTQKIAPVVKTVGRHVQIELGDTLLPNTTYTIGFGNALSDFTEKNILPDFSFSFSTGDEVDTLCLSGVVVDANTLLPAAGAVVGVYAGASDSLFVSKPLERITKTDASGNFTLRNLPQADYQIFALKEANRNNFFDQPEEQIAFSAERVRPTAMIAVTDSTSTDSVRTTKIVPDTTQKIVMRMFKEERRQQYLIKSERKTAERIVLFFNERVDSLPRIEPMNFDDEKRLMLQLSPERDTLTYWLADSALIRQDTLRFALHYQKTDSLGTLVAATDTLAMDFKQNPLSANGTQERRRQKDTKTNAPKQDFLKISANISNEKIEFYDDITLKFPTPIEQIDAEKFHFIEEKDSLEIPSPFLLVEAENKQSVELRNDSLAAERTYRVTVDSAAVTDIYGRVCQKQSFKFSLKSDEAYATLKLTVPLADSRSVVQLLSGKEVVVEQKKLQTEQIEFNFLAPGEYIVRMFVDENENEKWDSGNFLEKRQPETMYYFGKRLRLRANWVISETWDDFLTTPVEKQRN